MPDLRQSLIGKLSGAGWATQSQGDLLTAEKLVIQAKWLLGSRRVRHRLLMRLYASTRSLVLQETATEITIGIPPPSFSFTATKQKGRKVMENRIDTGIGGGGELRYGEIRKWLEQECARQDWTFQLKIGSP
ncbi:MAG: hypothetical protein M0P95_00360 [Sulfuritalea sp.]|nr:hypothetical protein [Sulfuritalea sp.]